MIYNCNTVVKNDKRQIILVRLVIIIGVINQNLVLLKVKIFLKEYLLRLRTCENLDKLRLVKHLNENQIWVPYVYRGGGNQIWFRHNVKMVKVKFFVTFSSYL